MTRRRRLLLLFAATCHLGLAVAGGLNICLWESGLVGRALTVYGALSGVDSGYSYFAPSVGAPSLARFTIVDGEGREHVDTLGIRGMREADIRVEHVVAAIRHRKVDDRLRDRIAVSWAATMFSRHRGAESVVVDVGRPRVLSMAELRRGVEAPWRSIFRARIVRSAAVRRRDAP